MTSPIQPYVFTHEQGQPVWFLGTLMLFKATAQSTGQSFSLIEQDLPAGFATPLHVHHAEDEAFYVLAGTLTFICGDQRWDVATGAFIFLPKDLAHGFVVTGAAPARLLQFTIPGGFEQFHVEMGEPAQSLSLPPPDAPDLAKMQILAAKYGVEIVGPPIE